MSSTSKIQCYKEDEVIIREGEKYGEMYKILSGKAALYLRYGEESEYLIGAVGEQKCFGEVSLLTGKPSPYTVVAVSDVMIMRVGAEDFDSFIAENPRNATDIMKNMANRIVMLNANIDLMAEELAETLKKQDMGEDITEKIRQYKFMGMSTSDIFSDRA